MSTVIAMTSDELKAELMTAVQDRISAKESQSAAAREWGVPQSTVNEIARGKDRWSVGFLLDLMMRDGLVVKVEFH